MSWWQHAALSKVALSIKIDREGDISAGPQPADILEKLSFLFCHPLLLHAKSIDVLTEGIWAMAFAPRRDSEQVQMYVALQSRKSRSLYLSVVISQFTFCVFEKVEY